MNARPPSPPATGSPLRDGQTLRILLGLGAGFLIGAGMRGAMGLWPGFQPPAEWVAGEVLNPLGQIFLRLLMFVVVPLVFASLAYGVAQLRELRRLGPLALRTFALFGLNMAVGVTLGLLMMNLVRPGAALDPDTQARLKADAEQAQGMEGVSQVSVGQQLSLRQAVDLFLPRNLLNAVVNFQLLPLIVFGLLCGAAITRLKPEQQAWAESGLQAVVAAMAQVVDWAMRLAPYAVAALVASVIVQAGFDAVRSLLLFVGGVLAVMVVQLFGTLSLLLRLFSRRRVRDFFRAVRVILATAFSTSSSNATLPTSIRVSRETLGVSHATAGFVLPLGATLNMSGTALYEGCVVLFVAQVYGFDLAVGEQIRLVALAVISAVAVAGVPGASLPVLMGLLAAFGLPPEGVLFILGFDRLLDMARTAVNVGADVVTACIVDDHLGPGAPPEARAGEHPVC